MKKFKFNLESVLRYRRNTEDNEKNALAVLNAQLATLNMELSALREEFASKVSEFEELSKQSITVHDIRANHSFLKNIEKSIELKLIEIEEQTKLVTRQTAVVVRAMQDTKVIDKLKEKKIEQYNKEEEKAEERVIDEIATLKNAAAR